MTITDEMVERAARTIFEINIRDSNLPNARKQFWDIIDAKKHD